MYVYRIHVYIYIGSHKPSLSPEKAQALPPHDVRRGFAQLDAGPSVGFGHILGRDVLQQRLGRLLRFQTTALYRVLDLGNSYLDASKNFRGAPFLLVVLIIISSMTYLGSILGPPSVETPMM